MSNIRQKQMKRRAEIIEKVMPLLKKYPFEEVSVQDICGAAGISVGSFYHYFQQKADLLAGLMELIDFYMIDYVFPLLTKDSELENLKIVSKAFAAYIMENGIEQSKLVTACCPTEFNIYQERRPLWLKLEEIIARGQEKGEFTRKFTSAKIADLLLIALSGVAVDWTRRDGNYSIAQRMEEFTDLFFPALIEKSISR